MRVTAFVPIIQARAVMNKDNFKLGPRLLRYRTLFARNTRSMVVWISTFLAVSFTALQIGAISPASLIQPSTSDLMWRGALVVYLWCWRFGCIFDTDIQELAYVSLPGKGQWRLRSYGIVALLVAVAVLLLWTQGNFRYFATALTVFVIVDHVGWRHIIHQMNPEARRSMKIFRKEEDYFAVEKLNAVRAQIQGNWKWWRLIAGGLIVIFVDAFAFIDPFRTLIVTSVQSIKPGISSDEAAQFSFSIFVVAFVVVMEVWHYVLRLKTKISINLIDQLSEKYVLQKP
jgi:hypothetical protein